MSFAVAVESGSRPSLMATSTASLTRSCRRSPSWKWTCRSGCRCAKEARRGITSRIPKLVGILILSVPRSSPPSRTLCSASSNATRMGSIRAKNSPPGFRRHHGPRRARQQPDAELSLEVGDNARSLGLRQAALPRGGGEAAEAGNPRVEAKGHVVLDQIPGAPAGAFRPCCSMIDVQRT